MAEADDSVSRVGYISHAVYKSQLKPGYHIYCRRGIYNHHGIYIGVAGCEVIHFSGDDNAGSFAKKIGRRDDATMRQVTELANERDKMQKDSSNLYGDVQRQLDEIRESHNHPVRIRSTTLKNFLNGATLRLVSYGSSPWKKILSPFVDASHTMKAMPLQETVKLAKHFLKHPEEWRDYHLKDNNCETFTTFCKTCQMDLATQLNYTRLVSEISPETPCQTFEGALGKYREQYISNS